MIFSKPVFQLWPEVPDKTLDWPSWLHAPAEPWTPLRRLELSPCWTNLAISRPSLQVGIFRSTPPC